MNKQYKIKELKTEKDIELLDNLFTIIFNKAQDKEHRYLLFTAGGATPSASSVNEKEFVLAHNSADGWYRIYTKISGTLRYIALT